MNKQEKAISNFETMNCNQAVFAAFGPDYGIPAEMCFNLGLSYGGGMAKQAKTCGAVTAAYTVIGLWSAQQISDKVKQKQLAIEKVKEFNELFVRTNGSLECKTLLKHDMSVPREAEMIEKLDLFNIVCPKLVGNSAEILDEILY